MMVGYTGGAMIKKPPANVGEVGSIPGSGRSPRVGNGNSLQYSCLEDSLDRGGWQTMVHGITKCQTWLSDWPCTHMQRWWWLQVPFMFSHRGKKAEVPQQDSNWIFFYVLAWERIEHGQGEFIFLLILVLSIYLHIDVSEISTYC